MIRYTLGEEGVRRRAALAALVTAVTSLAPLVLAVVLLQRLGWGPSPMFWVVVAAAGALVGVRVATGYPRALRRLRALVVTLDEQSIRVDGASDGWSIPRSRVARLVEVEGALGGVRVEAQPEPGSGEIVAVDVPRGGDGFAEVRAHLESWGPLRRRGRSGRAVRLAIGAVVVGCIFFLPFVLEDVVARSKLLPALLVVGTWIAMRVALRGR